MKKQLYRTNLILYGVNLILYGVSFLISAFASLFIWCAVYDAMTMHGPGDEKKYLPDLLLMGSVDLATYALIFTGGGDKPPYWRTVWCSSAMILWWAVLYLKWLSFNSMTDRNLGAWEIVGFLLLCKATMIATLWMVRWIEQTGGGRTAKVSR